MVDLWTEVAAERNDLADLLATLTPEQWDAPSLCEQWKVRDVVGHLVFGAEKMSFAKVAGAMVKNGFNLDKMLANGAIEVGKQPTQDLVKRLRENAASQVEPPFTKPLDVLSDTVIHTQDIRRPLAKQRAIPPERLREVLDRMKVTRGWGIGVKKRTAGVKLVATDFDWTHGEGPEVRGTGEALLMALSGRTAALDDLSGDGVATLRSRA
jgi:uncharacterized protein (TIGR03083 family)